MLLLVMRSTFTFAIKLPSSLIASRIKIPEEDTALVSNTTIGEEQNYTLSVSTYVEKEDTTEKVDIVELNARLQEIVKKENQLRAEIDEIIKEIEGLV